MKVACIRSHQAPDSQPCLSPSCGSSSPRVSFEIFWRLI